MKKTMNLPLRKKNVLKSKIRGCKGCRKTRQPRKGEKVMKYTFVNKELRIAEIEIKEIPQRMVKSLQSLDDLITYYDPAYDILFINADRKDKDFYEEYITKFFGLNRSERETLVKLLRNDEVAQRTGIVNLVDVVEEVITRRGAVKLERMLNKIPIDEYYQNMKMLHKINQIEQVKEFEELNTFMYGYILGKRAERKRRKKVQA